MITMSTKSNDDFKSFTPNNSLFNKKGNNSFFDSANKKTDPFFSPKIQAKLTVGSPNDKYEQEADSVADKVVQQLDGSAPEHAIQRKCSGCEEEETLQFKSAGNADIKIMRKSNYEDADFNTIQATRVENDLVASKGTGNKMPEGIRSNMESAFGVDFSEVNIHTNSKAASLNEGLGARAFTHGKDIYFNSNEYNPSSSNGKKLLAHELTHVVQQTGGVNLKAKSTGIQISKTGNNTIQRAIQIPAAVMAALAAAGRFLLACIIGAAFGVGLDYLFQRGEAWWNEQTFRWNSCLAIISGIIGCVSAGVGSALARVIFRYTGGHLERDFATKAVVWFITWLYGKFPVVPVAIIMKFLVSYGCVSESDLPAATPAPSE